MRPIERPARSQLSILHAAFVGLVVMATAISSRASETESAGEYRLVWADEFDKDGAPDPKNWRFESGFERNEELQWYQSDNARCEGGVLIIEARREDRPNPNFQPGGKNWRTSRARIKYSSSSLTTQGLHSWQYGRFEVRARFQALAGMWPAIWTLGVEGRWPANGEVDLMEFYKGHILANLFWGKSGSWHPVPSVVKKPLSDFSDPKWAESFHIWKMEWDETEIRLYVDDLLLNRTKLTDAMQVALSTPHPFRQPHYILLNLAMGGAGGDPSTTTFPNRFEVDYVRVYQRVK